MVRCAVCGQEKRYTREALVCWLGHDPDLPIKCTLQQMGDALGISRERLRQLLLRLGEKRRRGIVPGGTRPRKPVDLEARRHRRREYERSPAAKAAKKRRHRERWLKDAEYRERLRAKWRAKYARRKERRLEQLASTAEGGESQ